MPMLTLKEVAAELRVSQQWLKYWLVDNPGDAEGVPFYVRTGRRLKFEPRDVERILAHLRALEAVRLGPSIMSKARLAGLMSKVGGYDHQAAVREAAERRKEAAKKPDHGTRLLADLAVDAAFAALGRERPPKRRVRISRLKPPKPPDGNERWPKGDGKVEVRAPDGRTWIEDAAPTDPPSWRKKRKLTPRTPPTTA